MVPSSQRSPTVRESTSSIDEIIQLVARSGRVSTAAARPALDDVGDEGDEEPPISQEAPCSHRAGDSFGPYRLVRPIGCGGMGSVWVGHHRELDTEVAIKMLRSDMQESVIIERFLNEARLLARIDHPAVVHVSDFGYTDEAAPYLVMELLTGESLFDALHRRGQRFTAVQAVRLLLPIAHGLSAIHAKEIVHRDLKPDNIFLAEQDQGLLQPKLVDFGVARSLRGSSGARLTLRGGLLGSPQYMAPEQARGDLDIDPRADVWAFCAVLYECVTGRSLFPMEDNYERVLRRILDEKPKPLAEHGVDEPELWKILEQGLRKNRRRRWQSMDALGAALAAWLHARDIQEDVTGASLASCWMRPPAATDRAAGAPRHSPATAGSNVRSRSRSRAMEPSRLGAALAAGVTLGIGVGSLAAAWLSAMDASAAPPPVATASSVPAGALSSSRPVALEDLELVTDSVDEDEVSFDDLLSPSSTVVTGRPSPAPRAAPGHRGRSAPPSAKKAPGAPAPPGREPSAVAAGVGASSVDVFYDDLGF
jgi:eukaryotic-like serine/threonine-protein kinase